MMAEKEYIEREAAIEAAIDAADEWDGGYNPHRAVQIRDGVKAIPAADVRPVVRGKFEDAMQSCYDSPHVKCSVCGEYYWRYFKKFNFCPNCGAWMEEN